MSLLHPTQLPPSNIRLCLIHPLPLTSSPPSPTLAITLHTFPISAAPEYTALSYPPSPTDTDLIPALVNDFPVGLPYTLHCALSQFRLDISAFPATDRNGEVPGADAWPSGYIWVDMLCVNQSDISERAMSVKTREIYEKAACIMAFLGDDEDDENTELAAAKIHTVLSQYRSLTGSTDINVSPHIAALLKDDFAICNDPQTHTIWSSIQSLYARSWWKNIAILPALRTDRPVWLICGGLKIGLNDALIFALLSAMAPLTPEELAAAAFPIGEFVYGVVDLLSRGVDNDVIGLLEGTRHFDAADPRDKVYGVLGFLRDDCVDRLAVDYGKDVLAVYLDVVQTHLSQSSVSDLLDFLGSDGLPEGGMTGLPSWLPDWRNREQLHVPFKKRNDEPSTPGPNTPEHYPPVYHASGLPSDLSTLPQPLDPAHLVSIKNTTLLAKGYRIGYIYDLQPTMSPHDPPSLQQETIRQWQTNLRSTPYWTGESEEAALNRLIIADRPVSVHPSERDYALALSDAVRVSCAGRRMARVVQKNWTTDGMGLVPEASREGDQVFLLFGGQVFYVLRPVSNGYKFVGESYVHGLMDGEALDIVRQGLETVQDIPIV